MGCWMFLNVLGFFFAQKNINKLQEVSSKAFEDSVFHFCESAGVPMKREDDLREKQGVTPDVLFEAPVRFVTATEEKEFKWLECNFESFSLDILSYFCIFLSYLFIYLYFYTF